MLTILNYICHTIFTVTVVMSNSIMSFIGGVYAATKTSLGIAVPLVHI